ncbi:endonuclease/exonuclease/phosphatase family protein [Arenibacter aquaticus]|uniref:Endonuclease/exonuclease/phosphatase family protein n=1 Tax=Arenibacter aquaticus TaxID=2489054 RepID=A0A3S0CLJ7_9FLAO|nr:endonuclease/exonuclease/phosphatase family protein [Arenibacter aquaticus]RTE54130.1 endonuclease/exonuclease/phosphatase family protein [Arenibacter aquaticus]
MKIATFNIENLYHRDKDLLAKRKNKNVSDWVSELDSLLHRLHKSENDIARIRELSFLLGFDKIDHRPYGVLRKRQGKLFLKQGGFANEPRATHLTNWNGWVALQSVAISHTATENKARLIAETDADVLILQEVEDRASLMDFNIRRLGEFDIAAYEQILVLEGNDARGRGMAILTKNGYLLDSLKSHGTDLDSKQDPLFETDCQEYVISTPQGLKIYILSVQFAVEKDTKRKKQAQKLATIYEKMKAEGKELIMVCGTLNDVSFSDCLTPLLRETDLEDVSKQPEYRAQKDFGNRADYFRLGAYRMGVNIRQKDYMLLSYEMKLLLSSCGLNRKGMWPDRNTKWEVYSSLNNSSHAASAHPLIWGEFHGI